MPTSQHPKRQRRAFAASAVLAVAFFVATAVAPATAAELWVSEDEQIAWEGWGYLKTQTLGFHFRDIAMYPKDRAAQHTTRARLASDLYWGDARLSAEYEFRFTALTSGLEGGQYMPGVGSTESGRPRLWDPDPDSDNGTVLEHDIDRAFVSYPLGPTDIKVGRQAISWGSAWFWKPTDRFSPFSPMDVDPDVKRGVDAVRAETFLGEKTSLDLVATFERHPDTGRELWGHGGARLRTTFGRYDMALSGARFQLSEEANWMAGAEFTGELGKVGFRGEAAFNYLEESGEWDIAGVLGLDYRFPVGLTLAGELFYNGYGTDNPDEYADFFADPVRSERLKRGETFNIGRYYIGLSANYELTPLMHLTLAGMGNLTDPSGLVMAGFRWSVVENGRFTAGAMVPTGEKPDGLEPKSEFGSLPVLGYAVMKMSF